MINKSFTLDYRLSAGWLKPWVDGLFVGKAVGRVCAECKNISFAPIRACICGGLDGSWIELPGTASIIHRTDGLDGSFALARFDGADTNCVVRLKDFAADLTRGQLAAADNGLPALILSELKDGDSP